MYTCTQSHSGERGRHRKTVWKGGVEMSRTLCIVRRLWPCLGRSTGRAKLLSRPRVFAVGPSPPSAFTRDISVPTRFSYRPWGADRAHTRWHSKQRNDDHRWHARLDRISESPTSRRSPRIHSCCENGLHTHTRVWSVTADTLITLLFRCARRVYATPWTSKTWNGGGVPRKSRKLMPSSYRSSTRTVRIDSATVPSRVPAVAKPSFVRFMFTKIRGLRQTI